MLRSVRTLYTGVRPLSYSSVALQGTVSKPKDVTNGISEVSQHEEAPKEVVSGAPRELATSRVVRIYKEAKVATQSSHNNGKFWKLDWDVLGKGNRWENDLIGYQGSSDYMQGTILKFDTKESAIRFAQGQGWDHYIQEPQKKHFRKKDYSDNFYHSSGPLKHIRTK